MCAWDYNMWNKNEEKNGQKKGSERKKIVAKLFAHLCVLVVTAAVYTLPADFHSNVLLGILLLLSFLLSLQ